jgi:hypothetical protein
MCIREAALAAAVVISTGIFGGCRTRLSSPDVADARAADPGAAQAAREWDDGCVAMSTLMVRRVSECTSGCPGRTVSRPPSCDIIAASIAAGRISLVSAAVGSCLERLEASSCDAIMDIFFQQDPLPCPEVVAGESTLGGSCTTFHDCADGVSALCQLSGRCKGVCQRRSGMDET